MLLYRRNRSLKLGFELRILFWLRSVSRRRAVCAGVCLWRLGVQALRLCLPACATAAPVGLYLCELSVPLLEDIFSLVRGLIIPLLSVALKVSYSILKVTLLILPPKAPPGLLPLVPRDSNFSKVPPD